MRNKAMPASRGQAQVRHLCKDRKGRKIYFHP